VKIKFGARSDVGLSRQFNEDSYLVDENLGLFVVADGMGGSVGGEVASRLACDEIHNHVRENFKAIERFTGEGEVAQKTDVSDLLVAAVQQACATVYHKAQSDKELMGMGTTVVVLLSAGEHLFVAHVGDSRLYVLRGDQLHQLTRDHSLVEELKKLGKISTKSQVKAKYRNAITRAVGIYETVQVDTLDVMPLPKDRYLLCTDGLYSTAEDEELIRMLSTTDSEESTEALIRHANSRGGKDNITAIIVDVVETEPVKAELTQQKIATLKTVPLFKFLSFDELLRVVSIIEEKAFESGATIFHEDETGDALYVLLKGGVEVTKKGISITHLEPGDHFGELSLIDRFPRSATVKSTQASTCLVMSRQKFYDLIREYNALSVKLLWCLARVCSVRLRQTTDELGLARSLSSQVNIPGAPDTLFEE
jgi:serine/threonine protein phosphatase PrpC